MAVLKSSLYPNAKDESIRMVLSYCAAAKLDPLQKPVHIVPMSLLNPQTGKYEYQDVIMPGIGLYRIQAERSKTYAGMAAPLFGDMISQSFTDEKGASLEFTFPEWCEITVSKIVEAKIVTFTAREYWVENFATGKHPSQAPNAMWRKRPRGQLAKCAEAQALRKAWPEIGQAPTAEEMEGKEIDITPQARPIEHQVEIAKELPLFDDTKFNENIKEYQGLITSGKKTSAHVITMLSMKYSLSDKQKQILNAFS